MTAIPLQRAVEYPESDGRPMGETVLHIQEIVDLIAALKEHFRAVADVHVGGAAADGTLASATTGLLLRREGQNLRLVDAATGEPLLRIDEQQAAFREQQAALRAAEARARAEAEARRAAEEELASLRRELERLQTGG